MWRRRAEVIALSAALDLLDIKRNPRSEAHDPCRANIAARSRLSAQSGRQMHLTFAPAKPLEMQRWKMVQKS